MSDPKPMGFWKTKYFSPPSEDELKYKTGPTQAKYDAMIRARKNEVLARVAPMSEAERSACLLYMDQSTKHLQYRGFAACRICGERLGTADMLTPDGKFTFPQCWQHYITAHEVRPDEEFIQAAMDWMLNKIVNRQEP